MKKYCLSALFIIGSYLTNAQGIVVNADGTHSIVTNPGGTGIIVNANGTHSTVINSGSNISTVVNPNGTHSTLINSGNIITIVNPDGSHSVGVNNGTNVQGITPDQKNARDNNRIEDTPVESVYWFNLPDEDEAAPVSKPVRQKKIRKHKENE